MNTSRRQARAYLDGASLTSFWQIVNEAKISDDDKTILDAKFIHGHSYTKIADDLHISPEKVKQTIQRAYDKIAKLI